ncbi:hypothetical protein [Opitutus terrae]|uniref:Transglycosylase SLT domain-containing protein n=1 Tax=Opitutus terrae (strain DSM 11246 / JCM 15787 / PB90-1) TaxID=452637 RepID=B1ZVB2_OPITP|nr:hypothetical protein [Opitutus terrae]ACB76779.1 hypothetical protein Oter_3502 [Opitutus terrae PB90-1]
MQHVRFNSRLLFLLATLFAVGWADDARAVGRAEILRAIQAVENPHDTSRPGKYGELGPYQFRRSTWRMHTKAPFAEALNRYAAEDVAVRHYEWLKRGLLRNGVAPTPYMIALAWNGGLTAAVRGRASASAHDYASRVNNLAQEMNRSRLVSVE